MLSTDKFTDQLKQLSDLDHTIKNELSVDDINTEEISELVDKREQLLQRLLCTIDELPQLSQTEQWQQAIKETQNVVMLMQSKTTLLGQTLYKYRHGNKSVQQYKKFL
ncbi:putative flagellar rod protein FlaI [Vibrio ichthyoenteri ATCC 700023]|uniref:Flagellar protein FliT n=1 Tax=Vibrio ichthyoenteri ATCC 700023 TaxID=870968 RepID=F9RXB9_9VIBR|nr:flagellar protein FliT [Vibrio ichthyoenteri]EGU48242.1 putative flagellar rod protein FlaI [Vibrio ichthyoenteri ATCC 700023]